MDNDRVSRTKKLEKEVAEFVGVEKAVCLNSQTACAEMAFRLLGIGEGDEVIVPAVHLYGKRVGSHSCRGEAGFCGCAERLSGDGL